jgi:hypothetical protein
MFPESRVRWQLEKLLYKNLFAGSSQVSTNFMEPWKRYLPSHDNSIASQLDSVPYSKLHCIVVVKDESEMLPYFLSYYRNLGVTLFVVLDNDSNTRGSIDSDLI